MKHIFLAATLTVPFAIASIACTTTTTIPAAGAFADAGPGGEPDADDLPAADAGSDANGGKIGTRSDKGTKSVDVDYSGHGTYDCDTVCTGAGGSCKEGGGNGVGFVDRKYNDGTGTFGSRISSCDESESYATGTMTMTSMVCYCSDMTVPPTVRVRKSEGFFSCSKVCASWSLECSTKRVHTSYPDEQETTFKNFDCGTVPAATSHHYTCACDL